MRSAAPDTVAAPPEPAAGERPATVRDCLDRLGDDVTLASGEARAAVTGVVLHDEAEAHLVGPGTVVLGVGIAGPDAARALLETARRRSAAAVVLRAGLARRVSPPGPAVLELRTDVSWTSCHRALMGPGPRRADPGDDDLHAVANTVAAATGGATVIEDVRRRVLASSNLEGQPTDAVRRQGILDRQMPIVPEAEHEYQTIAQHPGAHRFAALPTIDRRGRLGVAVRAGGLLLGSIWVVDVDGGLPASALRALEQAAALAALSLGRIAERVDPEERARADAARGLLTGEVHRAADAAWVRGFHRAVVAAFVLDAAQGADAEAYGRRAAATLGTFLAAYREHAAITTLNGRLYALIGLASDDEDVSGLLGDAHAHLRRVLHVGVRVGVGAPTRDTAELVRSRQEAEEVLALADLTADVVAFDAVRSTVLLERLRPAMAQLGLEADPRLVSLLEHDAEHGTGYAETLRIFLEAFGDVGRAAARHGVHANTIRYRMRRVRELIGLELDRPDDRLLVALQLRLLAAPS